MLVKHIVTAGFLASLLAVDANAQSVFIPDNSATVGTCNVIPFGRTSQTDATWSNQKYQTILTAKQLGFSTPGAGAICDLAFVPCVSGTRVFKTIEIKLDYVKGTTLSQTFANNIGPNAVTVLKATNYEWHNTMDKWNRIGLQKTFPYVSALGNLCVQITVTGAGLITTSTSFPGYRTGAFERRYAFGWSTAAGPPAQAANANPSMAAGKIEVLFGMNDLHTFGSGCKGSNSQTPVLSLTGSAKLGQSVGIGLTGALPAAPFYLNIAVSTNQPPVDMGMFGAPTCRLYSPVTLLLVGVCTPNGTHSLKVPIPNDKGLICQRGYLQYFPWDKKANPLGLSSSNYGRVLAGN
ncbi:MAG: hypothetical protein ACYTGW_04525 [Planctomycetota bacterium]|jgi:hypothetical protein